MSGSWVVRDGNLYGSIYAAYDRSPYLHMIPAENIIQNISEFLGTSDVSVAFPESQLDMAYSSPRGSQPTGLSLGSSREGAKISRTVTNITSKDQLLQHTTEDEKSQNVTTPTGLTVNFRKMLSKKRTNVLRAQALLKRTAPQPPPYIESLQDPSSVQPSTIYPKSLLQTLPLVPQAPSDTKSIRSKNVLYTFSTIPLKWEDPVLLDRALQVIPLERLYSEAEEACQVFKAEAESLQSLRSGVKPAWGYQDCVVRAVMNWFKNTFFTWVNNPPCSRCANNTIPIGNTPPTAEETAGAAQQVEVYQCSNEFCKKYDRFPRYNDPSILLQTRRGRTGEWANCFGLICRAIGSRVRWVWCREDHVWVEVFSTHRNRWVHVDVCEGAWDQPRLYTEGMLCTATSLRTFSPKLILLSGWGKKLSYCLAFSVDGAMDVTSRYVRDPSQYGRKRSRVTESVLLHILDEIRTMRRSKMTDIERAILKSEDKRETEELRGFMISSIARNISKINVTDILNGVSSHRTDRSELKASEVRGEQASTLEWTQ